MPRRIKIEQAQDALLKFGDQFRPPRYRNRPLWPSPYDVQSGEAAWAFVRDLCSTWDEATAEVRRFPPHDYLRDLTYEWLTTSNAGRALVIEKSRRLVVSWLLCALDVWDAGRRRCNIVQGGKDYDKASDFVYRCWYLYESIRREKPDWNLPEATTWGNTASLRLDKMALANGSVLESLNSDGESFRGSGYTRVKLEELSSYRHIPVVFGQAKAVTIGPPGKVGGHVVAVANAAMNEHWQELKKPPDGMSLSLTPYEAYDAESGVRVVRIHYSADPLKDAAWALAEKATGWPQEVWDLEFEMRDSQAPGALWSREVIDRDRVTLEKLPEMQRVVVSIDPATTSGETADETGMVAAGKGRDGHIYVLFSSGARSKPLEWATKAVGLFHSLRAARIVAETNQGGDMVENTIHTVEKVPFSGVRAKVGKRLRASPVAALYAQGRVHHVGKHPKLESQMVSWQPGEDSPDVLDALVYAVMDLDPTITQRRDSVRSRFER